MGKKSENLNVVLDYLQFFYFAVKIFKIRTTMKKIIIQRITV